MDAPTPAPKVRKTVPHWLIEGLFIVVSVALGFGVGQYGEYRSNQELKAEALTGLVAEIEHNLNLLEPLVPLHDRSVAAMLKASDGSRGRTERAGIDVYFDTRPPLPSGAPSAFPFLRRSAWDAAVSSGALRLLRYDITANLSEIYRVQEIATGNVDRLANGPVASADIYDPARQGPAVRLLWLTLADIQSAEAILMDLYRQHLPAIRAATAR